MKKKTNKSLDNALRKLPLMDNPYLMMQVRNVALIDLYLLELERDLWRKYIDQDSTPLPDAMLVSALSQMWVFGIYELLRTWRQHITELIAYSDALAPIRLSPDFETKKRSLASKYKPQASVDLSTHFVDSIYGAPFQMVETDVRFVEILRKAKDVMQPILHRIEEIRIALAKHEVRGTGGRGRPVVRAFAPGYARIDTGTGSMLWLVEKKDGTSEMISRQSITDAIFRLKLKFKL